MRGRRDSEALYGATTRQLCALVSRAAHLDWHAAELAKCGDPSAPYPSGADLKKWVLQSWVDSNAAADGRAWQDQAVAKAAGDWVDMWADVGEAVVAAASSAAGTLAELPRRALERATGVPMWVWLASGALALGLLAFGVFKVLMVAAPAVVPAVVKRYLP